MNTSRPGYRPEIDGLRAIAVLGVVIFHVGLSAIGGFAGVDVFFVISGYLITALLFAEHARSGRIALPEFYARRARRLLPALLVVVIATVGLATLLLSPQLHEVQDVAKSGVASLTFVSNILFYKETGDYFAGPAEFIPLLHLWSLAVEEQFYLVWPIALTLLLRFRSRVVWIVVTAAVICSWLAALRMVTVQPQAAFYLTPFRAWEFGIGALVAMRPAGRVTTRFNGQFVTVGLIAVVASLLLAPAGRWFPAVGGLVPVLGTAMALMGIADGGVDSLGGRLLRTRPMVAIGRLSYSWYLWHWPPLALYSALSVDGGSRVGRIAIGVLTLGLAQLTLRYVEDPMRGRRAGAGGTAPRTLLTGFAASASVVVLFVGILFSARRAAAAPSEISTLLGEQRIDTDPCNLSPGAKALPPLDSVCVKGARAGPVAILWGDSHALHWLPFAESVAAVRGVGLVQLTMLACAPVPPGYAAHSYDPKNPMWQQRCQENNERALRVIRSGNFLGRPISTVFVALKWNDRIRRPFSILGRTKFDQRSAASTALRRAAVVSGFPAAIAMMPSTTEVVMMGPLPELRNTTPVCVQRRLEPACAMPRAVYDSLRADVMPILQRVVSTRPNTRIIDPADYFCDALQCPVRKHSILLFDDDEHVSMRAARGFADDWLRQTSIVALATAPKPALRP